MFTEYWFQWAFVLLGIYFMVRHWKEGRVHHSREGRVHHWREGRVHHSREGRVHHRLLHHQWFHHNGGFNISGVISGKVDSESDLYRPIDIGLYVFVVHIDVAQRQDNSTTSTYLYIDTKIKAHC